MAIPRIIANPTKTPEGGELAFEISEYFDGGQELAAETMLSLKCAVPCGSRVSPTKATALYTPA